MNRMQLVKELLVESRKSAIAQVSFNERLREYAPGEMLFMREAHFIMAVGLEDAPTMSELAHRLDVTQGAVTQIAARLESKGYITRCKAQADRRQTTVALTEKGKLLYRDHIAYDDKQFARVSEWYDEFSDEELALFTRYEQSKMALFTKNK